MSIELPMSAERTDIAIIGAGFSGISVVYQLAKRAGQLTRPIEITIFEQTPSIGRGNAYGTEVSEHILNVPVHGMSIDDDDPRSFENWLANAGLSADSSDFVQRRWYARYLSSCMAEASAASAGTFVISVIHSEVVDLHRAPSGLLLESKSGRQVQAAAVVLALGNLPSQQLDEETEEHLFSQATNREDLKDAAQVKSVALLGSGLSAVDVILSLESRGYKGNYEIISRHGFLPQSHAAPKMTADYITNAHELEHLLRPQPLRQILRSFRALLDRGAHWRDVFDSARPYHQQIWQGFSTKEKHRFLRHLRPLWESHRHRIPEESHRVLRTLLAKRRIRISRGKINGVVRTGNSRMVSLVRRDTHSQSSIVVDRVFNCLGLCSDIRRAKSPLLLRLLEKQLVIADSLNLGLRANASGRAIERSSVISNDLFLLGPMRRGELWESTAVREIRGQAKNIACELVQRFRAAHPESFLTKANQVS